MALTPLLCQVISIRPYITFTNRLGEKIFMKLSEQDEPKILRITDARVAFVYCGNGGPIQLQVAGCFFLLDFVTSVMCQ